MDVVDINRLETAIVYLQRITEGHNPVNNMPVDEDSVINNSNVIRCMSFIKEVLEELKRNEGYIGRRPRTNKDDRKKNYPLDVLKTFQYTGDKSITKLVEQLNGLTDMTEYKKLAYMPITAWLKKNGYLAEEVRDGSRKRPTITTEKGNELGIRQEKRKNSSGEEYVYITYNQKAQEFIVANMESILSV